VTSWLYSVARRRHVHLPVIYDRLFSSSVYAAWSNAANSLSLTHTHTHVFADAFGFFSFLTKPLSLCVFATRLDNRGSLVETHLRWARWTSWQHKCSYMHQENLWKVYALLHVSSPHSLLFAADASGRFVKREQRETLASQAEIGVWVQAPRCGPLLLRGPGVYTGWPKNLAHFCTPYNCSKYWPIFKLFSLWESGENV